MARLKWSNPRNTIRRKYIYIEEDFNGHVDKKKDNYETVYGGYGFRDKNKAGMCILDFAVAYDLIIANTYFKKRDEHLITFKSRFNKSQINFFLKLKT